MSEQAAYAVINKFYAGLRATINVWQTYEKGILNVRPGGAYDAALRYMQKAPLGSGKVLMINPEKDMALAQLVGAKAEVVDQDSTKWGGEDKGKYFRQRFEEIVSAFDFDGVGLWERNNRKAYVDHILFNIVYHRNYSKIDALGALKILDRFTEQTQFFTEENSYNEDQVWAPIKVELDNFSKK